MVFGIVEKSKNREDKDVFLNWQKILPIQEAFCLLGQLNTLCIKLQNEYPEQWFKEVLIITAKKCHNEYCFKNSFFKNFRLSS